MRTYQPSTEVLEQIICFKHILEGFIALEMPDDSSVQFQILSLQAYLGTLEEEYDWSVNYENNASGHHLT